MFQGNNFYSCFLQNEVFCFFIFQKKLLFTFYLKELNGSVKYLRILCLWLFIVMWLHSFCPIDHMASSPADFYLLFLINLATQQSDIFWRLLPVKVERFQVIRKADAMSYIFIVELTSERIYSNSLSSLCSTSKSSGFINH